MMLNIATLARHYYTMLALFLLLSQLFCSIACAQQLRPYYKDGNYTFPAQVANETNTKLFATYDLDSQMTIRWNTTYKSCNLFYAQWGDTSNSRQLASGLVSTSYVWNPIKVDYDNLTLPFHFRCVDPTNKDQKNSGFWSASFFLRDRSAGSSTTSSTTRTATVSSLTSTGSLPTDTSPVPPPSGSSPSLSGGAIAGIAVGAVSGVALLVTAVFFFLRRRVRGAKASEPDSLQNAPAYPPGGAYQADGNMVIGYYPSDPKDANMATGYQPVPTEMPAPNTAAELPTGNEARYELPTSNTNQR